MAKRKRRLGCLALISLSAILLVLGFVGYGMAPSSSPETTFVVSKGSSVTKVLRDLGAKGVFKSVTFVQFYARFKGLKHIKEGVYIIRPHPTIDQVLHDLTIVVLVPVRCPEGYWIARTATSLEKQGFCKVRDYEDATEAPNHPMVSHPVMHSPYEGKLLPDTYLLPPTATAKDLVKKQLDAFKEKASPLLKGKDENHVLTVASMVEV